MVAENGTHDRSMLSSTAAYVPVAGGLGTRCTWMVLGACHFPAILTTITLSIEASHRYHAYVWPRWNGGGGPCVWEAENGMCDHECQCTLSSKTACLPVSLSRPYPPARL